MYFSWTNNRLHKGYFVNVYNDKHRSVKEKYLEKDRSVSALLRLIKGGGRIKCTRGYIIKVCSPKFVIWPTQQLDTKEYSQYQSKNPCYQNVQSKVRFISTTFEWFIYFTTARLQSNMLLIFKPIFAYCVPCISKHFVHRSQNLGTIAWNFLGN